MSETRENRAEDAQRATQSAFLASFFLPALYCGFVMMPLDRGKATEPTFRLLLQSGMIVAFTLSAAIPAVVIGISKQPVRAKFGQMFLLALAWALVQFCAMVVLGLFALAQTGLAGVQ
jgi:hypothetical protein